MGTPRPLARSSAIFDTHGIIDEETMDIKRKKTKNEKKYGCKAILNPKHRALALCKDKKVSKG